MTVAWGRMAAWATALATFVIVVVSLVIAARPTGSPSFAGEVNALSTLHALISVTVGAVVIDRRGNHLVGWLFCLSGLCWAVAHAGAAVAALPSGDSGFAGADLLVWGTAWSSFLAFALAPTLIMFVFPTGRLASPGWRWSFGFALAATAAGVLGYSLAPGPLDDIPVKNPFGIEGPIGTVLTVFRDVCWPLLLLSILAGVLSLRQRMRGASIEERQQIKWIVLAGFALVAFVTFWGVMDVAGRPQVAARVGGLFLPVLPIALGIAIIRHRLYDIDVLINRTLVYVTLSAVLAAIYLGAVVLLGRILSPLTADSNLAIAASTLTVAALFRPLRGRIQDFINRRFYRQKYDAVATLGRFSHRLRDEIDLDALRGELLLAVDETMHPAHAGLWLKSEASS